MVPTSHRPWRAESRAMWVDPDSAVISGVLLSDRIKYYVDEVGLIAPFIDAHLMPASYDLTLGSECWYSDHAKETGQAKRSCPLHNISSEKICLKCGEPFAVIEFQKTTPFAQREQWQPNENMASVRGRGEARLLRGLRNHACITFPAHSLNRAPVKGYLPPGKQVSNSIQGLASAVDVTERKVDGSISKFEKRLWNLNVIVYVTVITVAISVSTYFIGVVNFQRAAYETNLELRNKVSTLEAEDSSLQLRISNLEQKLSLQNNEQRLGTPAQKRK